MTDVKKLVQTIESDYLHTKAIVSLLEAKLKEKKDRLKEIENQIGKYFNDTNQKSLKTEIGISAVKKKQRYYNYDGDMSAYLEWAVQNDEIDTVTYRLKVSGVDDYRDVNDGELPPGVEEGEKYNVSVSVPRHILNEAKENFSR